MKKLLFVGLVLALLVLAAPAAATITYKSNQAGTGVLYSLSIDRPSSVAAGDLLLAQIDLGVVGTGNTVVITPPDGWSLVRRDSKNGAINGMSQAIYYKMATSGDVTTGSYTWRFDKSATSDGAILCYSGVDPVAPVIASSGGTGTTPVSTSKKNLAAPGVTAEADSMLVGCYGILATTTFTKPSGMTERYQKQAAGVPLLSILGADKAVGADATGDMVATVPWTVSGFQYVAQLVALRIAPVHTVQFATTGLAAGTSVGVTYSGTGPANIALAGSPATFSSPGPSAAVQTRPGTQFAFAFPAIAGYSLESTSQASPVSTGADGGTTTVTATYLALSAPVVTPHPTDRTVTYGSDATFSASAGGNPAPTLQWQERTDGTAPWTDISGATTSPLTVTAPPVSMTGRQYRAVFSNSQGTTPSDPATLTVDPRPLTVTADPGQTKVRGTPDPVLTYQLTAGSLVAGDLFSGALSRAPGEGVGDYAILTGSLTAGDNYALTLAPGGIFTILPEPPVAAFTADPSSGVAPLSVRFTNTSTGEAITGLSWDFEDDGTPDSTEQNPDHTYTAAGTYTVNLTVTNAGGSDNTTRTVTVAAPAPAIDVETLTNGEDADTPPGPTVPVGSTVSWTYIVTNTGNVPLEDIVVTDDQGVVVTAPNTALAPGLSMTATAAGTAVAGQYANVGTATGTPPSGPAVTASDPSHYYGLAPPAAAFTTDPTAGTAPLAVRFTNTSTGEAITGLSWDFGDGGTSTEQSPSHTFTAGGTYTVTLTVTNPAGSTCTTRTVSVAPRPWIAADFTANVTSGPAPLTVQFTDSSIGTITYRAWEFGDGATSTETNPVHTFTAPGTYTVRLLVSNFGTTDRHDLTVTVTAGAAPAPLVADFEANATSGAAPLAVQFTDASTGDGIDGRWWFFGDGGSATGTDPVHVYTAPGTYAVTLVVTNAGGLDSEAKPGYVSVMPAGPPPGGSRGYFLVSTEPAGAEIFLEDISGTRYPRGNTTAGPLNVSIYLTATPMRKIVANLTGYGDAVYSITQYPPIDGTVPVLLTLDPVAAPTPTPTPTPGNGGPYPGPHALPTVIQAEDFDLGGEGVAYRDLEPANLGGAYRPAEGVDIERGGSNYNVGWVRAGESLAYSVDAPLAGSYTLALRAANPDATAKPVAVYLDGVPVGQVLVGGTGAWTAYGDFAAAAPLAVPAGRHVLTLAFEGVGRINLDWLRLGAGSAPAVTTTTTAAPPAGGASFSAAPLTAPKGAAVKFTVTPASGKSIRSAWWSFDAPAHLTTWNSRAVSPTFFYPARGTFSPLVRLTYTDGTTEEVHRVGYVRAT
jgi:PKD repeat protein